MNLADRMKEYEQIEAGRMLDTSLPVLCRIDGKKFSSFTSDLTKPLDRRLSSLMVTVTRELVELTNARLGFTQSDEISLLLYVGDKPEAQLPYNGKVHKLVGELAAYTSVRFNFYLDDYGLGFKDNGTARFDARVWNLPLNEVYNYFLWRYRDGVRNAVAMVAQSKFSHKKLQGLDTKEMQDLLIEYGYSMDQYPDFFRYGTVIQRKVGKFTFTPDEVESLPEKHHARQNPNLEIERTLTTQRSVRLDRVSNEYEFLFFGEDPE